MKKILIFYSSRTGQTKKIAECIQEEFIKDGFQADLTEAQAEPLANPQAYDAVIVGGPVYSSQFPRELKSWLMQNKNFLAHTPGAFFSVCLGILQKEDPKVQKEEKAIVDRLLKETNWQPQATRIFAGILAYSQYGWLKKIIMRQIAGKAGGSKDTTKDHVYTDWSEVRSFAHAFSGQLR